MTTLFFARRLAETFPWLEPLVPVDQSISCGGSCDQRVQTLQEAENVGKLENVFFQNWKMLDFRMSSCQFQWFQWFRHGHSGCLVEAQWRRLVMDGVRRRPKTQWVLKISSWWIYAAVPFPKCRQWSSMNWESPLASLYFGDFWRQAFDTGLLEVMVKCQIEVEVLQPQAPEQMVWFPVLPAMSDEVRQVFRNMTACWQQIDGM